MPKFSSPRFARVAAGLAVLFAFAVAPMAAQAAPTTATVTVTGGALEITVPGSAAVSYTHLTLPTTPYV